MWWGWTWGIIFACRKGELQDDFELRAVSPVQHGIHLIRRSKVLYIYHHCAFLSIQNSAVLSWRCLIGWGTRAFSKRCLVMPVTRDSRGGVMLSPTGPKDSLYCSFDICLTFTPLLNRVWSSPTPAFLWQSTEADGPSWQTYYANIVTPTHSFDHGLLLFFTTASFEQVEKCDCFSVAEADAAPLTFFRFKLERGSAIMCTSNRRWQHPAACSQELKCSAAIDFSFATTVGNVGKWIQQRLSQSARSST